MLFHHFRLRALPAAGGFTYLLLSVLLTIQHAPAQDEVLPRASAETVRRAIQQLPPPPSPHVSPQASPSAQPPSSPAEWFEQQLQMVTPSTTPAPAVAAPPVAPAAVVSAAPPTDSLRAALTRLNLPLPLPKARVVVHKAQRKLELFNGDTLVKTYRVALGPNPSGHKKSQGDGRTPEGQFYICTRNAKDSAFHIFLGLSYPSVPDATRGVNSKVITWREYQIINQRLASRGVPLWETRLGGWIGIHGGTGQKYAQRLTKERKSRDWTAGCVALTDQEIKEIYSATRLGTPVFIKP